MGYYSGGDNFRDIVLSHLCYLI